MKRKKINLSSATKEQPPLPKFRGLSSELNLDGLEEYLVEKPKSNQTKESISEEKISESEKKQLSFERSGLTTVEPSNMSEIIELLSKYICDVHFNKVTSPGGPRTIRCSLNEKYIGRRIPGMGAFGDLIKIWDMDQQGWKSFYGKTVKKISYDANPYKPGSNT
jgi:hypothetical protein